MMSVALPFLCTESSRPGKQDLLVKGLTPRGKGSCAGFIQGHELQTFPLPPLGFPAEIGGGYPQRKGKLWGCVLTP